MLFSLLLIYLSFIIFYQKKIEILKLFIFSIIIYFTFKLIIFIKHPYFPIFLTIFILSNFIIFLKSKIFYEKFLIFSQTILIIIISTGVNINFDKINFTFSKIENDVRKKIKENSLLLQGKKELFFHEINFELTEFSETKADELFQKKQYFSNEHKMEKLKIKNLTCSEPFLKICKKINTFAHTIYYMKHATLEENKSNDNIVNNKLFIDPTKILLSVPLSAIKGFIMPFKITDNYILIIISILKITLFFLLFFSLFILLKKRNYTKVEKIFYIVFLLTPLSLAIDLVTSNFFTYLRYVMPINIIMCSVVSIAMIEIFTKKNDKFSS